MQASVILRAATWPEGWEQVKETAIASARHDEYRAAVASDLALTGIQPCYEPLVRDIVDALVAAMPMEERNPLGVGDQPPF